MNHYDRSVNAQTRLAIIDGASFLFVAPFYDRSGYGGGARALVKLWHQAGMRVRIQPVGARDDGIDDYDLEFLRRLESTQLTGTVVLIVYHVASAQWLNIPLPDGSIRAIITTHEVAWQGQPPNPEFIAICNAFDLVLLSREEIPHWQKAGLNCPIVSEIRVPHVWAITSESLPLVGKEQKDTGRFRFLTIAMFQPRRRWRALFEAFLNQFKDDSGVELYVKTSYPDWHPVIGKPKKDLERLVTECKERIGSHARIIIDDEIGTRMELVEIIDKADVYVSTDICPTAGTYESLLRGKRIVLPNSFAQIDSRFMPESAIDFFDDSPIGWDEIDDEFLQYSPSFAGLGLPQLRLSEIGKALVRSRQASQAMAPWSGYRQWLESQQGLFSEGDVLDGVAKALDRKRKRPLSIIWEGPYRTAGSLASVNRHLVRQLSDSNTDITVVPVESVESDADVDGARLLVEEKKVVKYAPLADITIRHQWPPNFRPPATGRLIFIQPWEFGGLPQRWVDAFNRVADEIWVPSTWVRDCYVDSGVDPTRVFTIANGVDPEVFSDQGAIYRLTTSKKFKFVYVGGAIQRKGLDVLLDAFDGEFSADDDVCLVVKAGQYEHYADRSIANRIRARRGDPTLPEVEFIEDHLTESDVAALYRACDVTVVPYRGEGFCLPLAESLACATPVIATAAGGAADFLRPEFADLVPAKERDITASLSGDQQIGPPCSDGYWVLEPDLPSLKQALSRALADPERLKVRGRLGRSFIKRFFSWQAAATKAKTQIQQVASRPAFRHQSQRFVIVASTEKKETVREMMFSFSSAFDNDPNVNLRLSFPDKGEAYIFASELGSVLEGASGGAAGKRIEFVVGEDYLMGISPAGGYAVVARSGVARSDLVAEVTKRFNRARRAYRRLMGFPRSPGHHP